MSWRYAWFGATVLIDIDFYLDTFLIVPAFLVVINISVTEKQNNLSTTKDQIKAIRQSRERYLLRFLKTRQFPEFIATKLFTVECF